jgi:glutamate N-acetyltransferase/amino-acid N-acetyltransferase
MTDAAVATPTLPKGFLAGAVHCGLRKDPDHPDLGLLVADEARPVSAVYTQNRLVGAHIHVCREHLRKGNGLVRAIVVNARNANCATGDKGIEDARSVCRAVADRIGCPLHQVLMASTGPIGAPLPTELITAALDRLLADASKDGAGRFARAIMTTDTWPKTRHLACGPGGVTAFAKGSGMIHPDMATMLGFLLTDLQFDHDGNAGLRRICDRSFHRVTVDGDTSPNDTVFLWTGATRHDPAQTETTLVEACQALSREIARDGEGASRLITVQVRGAKDADEAQRIGRTIATSPLVKTAVAGRDPNWGRILSAAGRAGVPFEASQAKVWVGDTVVYTDGVPHPEREGSAHRHMTDDQEVILGIDIARGDFDADFWTCDLTQDYITINADYRT